MNRPRTRSNPPPPADEGQILVTDEVTGLSRYVRRGDADYDTHLEEWNRRNNIPPDVIPPQNSREEEQPPDHNNPPFDDEQNNDDNINDDDNHISNNHLTNED